MVGLCLKGNRLKLSSEDDTNSDSENSTMELESLWLSAAFPGGIRTYSIASTTSQTIGQGQHGKVFAVCFHLLIFLRISNKWHNLLQLADYVCSRQVVEWLLRQLASISYPIV